MEAGQVLRHVLGKLSRHYGASRQEIPSTPFALVLWEQVAYLVDDEQRARAFAALKRQVGITPERILAAPPAIVERAIQLGGMHPAERARRIRQSAAIALELGGLDRVLALPFAEARRALTRFAGIGVPGAEKILLMCGNQPVLALDSNGVRVLLRIGYGNDLSTYSATYRVVQRAASAELPRRVGVLVKAYHLLRQHGQELCRRTQPECERCPVRELCSYFQHRQ